MAGLHWGGASSPKRCGVVGWGLLSPSMSWRAPPLHHLRRTLRRALGTIATTNKTSNSSSLYSLFFAHSRPLKCALGPLSTLFFFSRTPPFTRVCGGSLSDMDRLLSGWGYILVLGPVSFGCIKGALSARSSKTWRYANVVCCSLKISPSSSAVLHGRTPVVT